MTIVELLKDDTKDAVIRGLKTELYSVRNKWRILPLSESTKEVKFNSEEEAVTAFLKNEEQ